MSASAPGIGTASATMKEISVVKLISTWCLLMLSFPVAIIWIRPDFLAGDITPALLKLATVLAVVSAGGLAFMYALGLRWSLPTRHFEEFIAALPNAETDLPDDGPPEMQSLSRAMRLMAERVRQVVERANLEASRRETILACMAEGVLAVNTDMKVVFCNDAFAEAFQTRTPVPEGRTLYELVREPELRNILERVLKTGTPETDRLQLPSAAGRWFEARALPIGDVLRRGAIIVLHDITDLHRQEQLRKDFVADVSHELRTPLSAIRGYAETLLDGALEDHENNRKFVEIILSHAIRLNNIASDLLVLSELDSQQELPTAKGPVSLLEVVKSVLHTVENAAAERRVKLDASACSDCVIIGHRHRVEQVLLNLLDNAIKFNKPDGEVRIECDCTVGGRVRVSVIDTGIGIPSEDLKRVFERFYRVDKARSRPVGGTGLGLPIVKEVVDRMNGSITVESQLGRGSRFTIFLPSA